VLRGGAAGPNYGAREVAKAVAALQKARVNPRVLVDASHDNSGKDPLQQPAVLQNVGEQLRAGEQNILGVMLESHLHEGRQELVDKATLSFGQSITDGCIGFESTCSVLEAFAADVRFAIDASATNAHRLVGNA
jgi:3-deoxy-7-phosphoheptulonate synthase